MTAAAPTILVVDDEPSLRRLLSFTLARRGFRVALAETGEQAVEMIELDPPDICLLDVMLPGIDGLEVLRRARRLVPDLPVIMMTAFGTVERAVEAMKLGAHDFIAKPFDMDRLSIAVKNALSMGRLSRQVRRLTDELRARSGFRGIVGADAGLAPTVELVRKAVPTDLTVLLLGESGVGKELFARAIHDESPRAGGPFVAINCAALPEALLESELFGHERGAFTGADRRRVGRFEAADGGTLFLDEVAETSPAMQAKLLRALQERRAAPLGGSEARPFDVRVVCASNRDLQGLVREGLFREDLYFRLAAFPVTIPPLRERREDVPLLARHILGEGGPALAAEALERLERHDWPGNVRELQNALRRAAALCGDGPIRAEHLPQGLGEPAGAAARRAGDATPRRADETAGRRADETAAMLPERAEEIATLEDVERRHVLRAVELCGGNLSEAARRLGVGRSTLYRKLEGWGVAASTKCP